MCLTLDFRKAGAMCLKDTVREGYYEESQGWVRVTKRTKMELLALKTTDQSIPEISC